MISASAVTTRHELIMSLVAGLNPIRTRYGAERLAPVRKLWTTEGAKNPRLNFSRAFR
ncbi:hypothetical protein [Ligilactobacillus ruminis]|uniref:hypothetical protein n=1 Tax=Ligilactobacillus ruminis TaxID=1623 RepID=UPI0034A4B089